MRNFRFVLLFIVLLICGIVWLSEPMKGHPAIQTEHLISDIHYVLDAGHGGEDGGAISLTGVPESHINLDITKKLDVLLGFLGSPTIMTRTEDI